MSKWEWDLVYSNKGMAAYPDNMLVRFVAKHYYNVLNRKDVKFLDVGCGAGSSTWYLSREGFEVVGIDHSKVAMEKLRIRLQNEGLGAFLMCGDITELPLKEFFDVVVDVSSTCYVPQDKVEPLMQKLHGALKPGGRYFQITPTNDCAREPFNHAIGGVNLNARFQTYVEVYDSFKLFKEIKINPYNYIVDRPDGKVRLWAATAEK